MAEMGPPANPSLPPPLHQLEWPVFERLTVDLFEKEDGVATAELHGLPGPQSDYGVDVIARRHDGGVELASCKRYNKIRASQVAQWSLDMLKHREASWAQYEIRKFVLATTAENAADVKIHQQVESEKRRFAEFGIAYELWGPRTFRHKLQPHRTLTANYLPAWVEAICGPLDQNQIAFEQKANLVPEAIVAQLADLQGALSAATKDRIEAALEDLRSNRLGKVRCLVAELHERSWSQLTSAAKAACLRLEGSLALQQDLLVDADAFANSARELDPAGEPRLEARLAAERNGPEAGLDVLGEPTSRAGRQLRASLLIASGRQEDATAAVDALLGEGADDPEILRLAALERLLAGDRGTALVRVSQAEIRAGHWIAIKRVAALTHYAAALSPALGADWVLSPNPFERALARQDAEARNHLAMALAKLDELAALGAEQSVDRTYRLAILASSDGKRGEADALARELLEARPGNPVLVA